MSASDAQGRPRGVILQASHIERAMQDPNFFNAMPEFSPVARRREELEKSSSGCSTCRRRRIRQAATSDFVRVMNTLPDSALGRLKRYFGFERMLIRAIDPDTRRPLLKEI